MTEPGKGQDLFENIGTDVKEMAKQGFDHPGSRQVLTGMAVGAVAAMVLPVVTWPMGLIAGAGFMLWQRNK